MGTRCTINFCYPDGQVCAKVYRHSDGYPDGDSGVPADLGRFFDAVKAQTSDTRFGDPCFLAARFVVWQADQHKRSSVAVDLGAPLDFLGVGVLMEDPGDIEYTYNLTCGSSSLPPVVRVVNVRGTSEPCEACGGCGALFNTATVHYLVERCDACKRFASDHEAGEVVRAAFEKKGS